MDIIRLHAGLSSYRAPFEQIKHEVPEMTAQSWQKWHRTCRTKPKKEMLSFTWNHSWNSSGSWESKSANRKGCLPVLLIAPPVCCFTLANPTALWQIALRTFYSWFSFPGAELFITFLPPTVLHGIFYHFYFKKCLIKSSKKILRG